MWCYVHADRYTVVVDCDSGVDMWGHVHVGVDVVATLKLMCYKSM
jgi:hypothetical protein